ncbi:Hypothetical predicted protein [Paramuricea clavata]|uniref:Uncharacterized protein n=1 Tax=Paramuricea clavata TaxID=317549 RepID=A0A6S7I465_PARCT|nr:Hypothetical predicted protein [Paramuricea clavata]
MSGFLPHVANIFGHVTTHVNCAKRTDKNVTVYDRRHACLFCGELSSKIARHITTKHKEEKEVAVALPFRKKSKERKKELTRLRLKGDYHHNMNTLEIGEGELVVVRRPGQDVCCNAEDFLPCEFCLGFMRRRDLWKHQLACEFKSKTLAEHSGKKQQVQRKAKSLIASAITGSNNERLNKIISAMKYDSISDIVKKDKLIKDLGGLLIQKCKKSLIDGEEGQLEVGIPSLALKLGYSLSKCATCTVAHGLRIKDESIRKDAKNFKTLMESEWEYRVSHHSLATLHEWRFNKVNVPPLAEDIANLRSFVDRRIGEESDNLKRKSPTKKRWTLLARLLLARVLMLNKRRSIQAAFAGIQRKTCLESISQLRNSGQFESLGATVV